MGFINEIICFFVKTFNSFLSLEPSNQWLIMLTLIIAIFTGLYARVTMVLKKQFFGKYHLILQNFQMRNYLLMIEK